MTSLGLSEFFYNANQKPSEVELELKEHFLKFARGRFVPPWYCKLSGMHNGCQPDKVRVYV